MKMALVWEAGRLRRGDQGDRRSSREIGRDQGAMRGDRREMAISPARSCR